MKRKAVHLAMGGFALLLPWLTWPQAALAALAALVFNLFLLHPLTGGALLREEERERGFSLGIVLYPAAVLALIVVFRDRLDLAAATWGLLAFGDGMATVAGLTLGGPHLPWNPGKSWWGFVGFTLAGTAASAFLLHWVRPDLAPSLATLAVVSFAASLAAAFAESLPTGIDDNIAVPLVGGTVLYVGSLIDPVLLSHAAEGIIRNARWGLAVNVVLALLAYLARGVGVSGAVWGAILGTFLYAFAGGRGFLMLLVFFVLGTAATRIGWHRKAALGIAQERGGRRGAKHAFANTLAGVVFAFLSVATPDASSFLLAVVAAFATAAADTVASEIGQAYGRRHYLVTTLERVRAGTDGAVSMEGTLAGILASLFLALVAWGTGLVSGLGAGIVVAAAFLGTTLESYLGATLEQRGMVDKEIVNFANTVAGGVAAMVIHGVFGS